MYRLLLADDERLELDTLKNCVDWESMGIGEILTARNGQQAWEKILAEEPDIVLTDIQMPVMDGITLAKKIRELNDRTKIVFLTGYDEVEYLREAIRVSAVDYILKPFSDEAIRSAMEKVGQKIEKDRLIRHSMKEGEDMLLHNLCLGAGTEEEQENWLLQLSQIRELEQASDRYGILEVYGVPGGIRAHSVKQKFPEILSVWKTDRTLLAVTNGHVRTGDTAGKILGFLGDTAGPGCSAACARGNVPVKKLHEAWQMLNSYEQEMFFEKSGTLLEVSESRTAPAGEADGVKKPGSRFLEDVQKRLVAAILAGREDETGAAADELFTRLRDSRTNRDEVLRILDKLYYQVERQCSAEKNQEEVAALMKGALEEASLAANLGQIREGGCRCLCELAARNAENSFDTAEYVARKVKDYIRRNYASQFTTNDLAEEIHLTPNYIRTIFKEETGQTILEYLTAYRFDKACELLRATPLKVKEISVQVGYENVSYFCTLFTRIYGMTPNNYRKKYK